LIATVLDKAIIQKGILDDENSKNILDIEECKIKRIYNRMKIIVFLGKMISDSHPMDLHEQPKYIK
jgi:hypothetical protein